MKHNNYLQWFHKVCPLAFHSSYRILPRFTAISPRIEIEIDMVANEHILCNYFRQK